MDSLLWNSLFLLTLMGIGTAWAVIEETLWPPEEPDHEDLD